MTYNDLIIWEAEWIGDLCFDWRINVNPPSWMWFEFIFKTVSSKFADGFPNLFVKNAELMRNRHVAFLASFHRPDVIFEQLSIIYALPRMFVGSFSLVLPFFPTGTLERVRGFIGNFWFHHVVVTMNGWVLKSKMRFDYTNHMSRLRMRAR